MRKCSLHFFTIRPEEFYGKIPFIVTDLIAELNARQCCKVEGIFRLNGGDVQIRQLIDKFDHGKVTDWSQFRDIHTVSTTLKRYFSQMGNQDPIFPFTEYDRLIGLMKSDDSEEQINGMKKLVSELHPVRIKILYVLCNFLKELSVHFSVTQMTIDNLAICFAQNVIAAPPGTTSGLSDCKYTNAAFGILLSAFDRIFEGVTVTEADYCTQEDLIPFYAATVSEDVVVRHVKKLALRENSLVKFAPVCKKSKHPKYKRPSGPTENVLYNQPVAKPAPEPEPELEAEPKPETETPKAPIAVKPALSALSTEHRMSDFGGRFRPIDLSTLSMGRSPITQDDSSDSDSDNDDQQRCVYVLGGFGF